MRYDPKTDEYHVDTYTRPDRPVESKRDGWLLLIILLIVALAFIAGRVTAAADPLCTFFDALTQHADVETAQWIGYPDGWRDYPETWDYEVFLPILDGGILQRVAGDKAWLWGYWSLETWTDDNGEHDGNHAFCEKVLIIDQ